MFRKLIVIFMLLFLIPLVFAWWDASYEERYPHNPNGSGYTGIGYFGANQTGWYGIINDSGNSGQVYTYNSTDTTNDYIVANETDELCWFDTQNDRSNCPKKTGSASGVLRYYALDNNSKEYIGNQDGNKTNFDGDENTTGQVGSAYDFDGTSDFIDIPSFSTFSSYSVSIWARWDNINDGDLDFAFFLWDNNLLIIRENGDGTIHYYTKDENANSYPYSEAISQGTWYHAVMTWDGSTWKCYLDGTEVHSESVGSMATSIYDGSAIGADNNVDPTNFMTGAVDDVRIYDTVLTSTEVSNLYSSTKDKFPYLGAKETQAPVDTCSCPGAGNDWEINMSDYCNITSDCDLTTGTLNFTGSGETRINATINTTDLGDPGTNGILRILSDCLIWVI